MPYEVRKLPFSCEKTRMGKLYRVRNKITGEIKASATTRTNALRQVRLLNAIEKKPVDFYY